ncbi:50S ribosomal protein L3 [Verrucomicrobiota bacterium]
MRGLIGRKLGMTQVFDEVGRRVAVTVIQAGPCVVIQRKTAVRDGYDAVQLGFGVQKEHRVSKAQLTRFKNAKSTPMRWLREFALDEGEQVDEGETVTAALFEDAGYVDVCGLSKGRGFQGVVKRYGVSGGPFSHGGHSRRRIGAIGQCAYPGRVAKNQAMPGRMGTARVTQQNLKVIDVDTKRSLILVHGAVPGPTGGILSVTRALKRPDEKRAAG